MYIETGSNAFNVLERALKSPSKALRRRAVAMLAHVDCGSRTSWLESALADTDPGVRDCAVAVIAWVLESADPPWPRREDPMLDVTMELSMREPASDLPDRLRWEWEYVVEVWREDGQLVGVFLANTCAEDDQHATCIAMGQAILASMSVEGEAFDSARAASFVVEKRRVQRAHGQRREKHGHSQRPRPPFAG